MKSSVPRAESDQPDHATLADLIKAWSFELGFQQCGISGVDLSQDEEWLQSWLNKHYHGEMHYMAKHGTRRSRPEELEPGTLRVISVRMDYLPGDAAPYPLDQDQTAAISRYALGRDYHKLLRKRLQKLADRIQAAIGDFGYRVFVDSAPVLEKALARNAGLGWIGKHTNLINRHAGSWFFLGELFTDLPLPTDSLHDKNYCGSCTRCLTACPTDAIVAPYQVDARRCISYLTIELRTAIPEKLRPLIGNRIYGCDDCQIVCPWNRYARSTVEADFAVRHGLDQASLLALFAWDEATFLKKTEGSAIRRIGFECWQRNLAVALGNAKPDPSIRQVLIAKQDVSSTLVREHVDWALAQQTNPIDD